jgi:hypothetical protein
MNIGHSSRLSYDDCAYPDRLKESTDPLNYKLSTDQIYNNERCLPTTDLGSRYMGHGVSLARDTKYAKYTESQDLVDLESVLSNRDVKTSKCRRGKVNHADLSKYKLYNARLCGNKLEPENTRLSHPPAIYRDMNVNRFYNLINDPQEPIFWDFASNTRLETQDNYQQNYPQLWLDLAGPKPLPRSGVCKVQCRPSGCDRIDRM